MTPTERRLLESLFERLRGTEELPRDREAEALIDVEMRRQRHAGYVLAQTVLVQEVALRRAGARIGELERQLGLLRAASSGPAAKFLGELSEAEGTPVPPPPVPGPARSDERRAGRRNDPAVDPGLAIPFLPAEILDDRLPPAPGPSIDNVVVFPGLTRFGLAVAEACNPVSFDQGLPPSHGRQGDDRAK
jgi:hypothetical protein